MESPRQRQFGIAKGEIRAWVGKTVREVHLAQHFARWCIQNTTALWKLDGREVNFRSVQDAIHFGIAKVHQEISYIPELSVGQNITFGL